MSRRGAVTKQMFASTTKTAGGLGLADQKLMLLTLLSPRISHHPASSRASDSTLEGILLEESTQACELVLSALIVCSVVVLFSKRLM
jgi:hypothetical protein